MVKTRRKRYGGATKKRRGSSLSAFQKEITIVFFEMLLTVKLFHWNTHSHSVHKATDELYGQLNSHMDEFMEVLLGKSGSRIDFGNQKTIQLNNLKNLDQLISKVNEFKSYLVGLSHHKGLSTMTNSDLLNIRDEILGDMNKFLYLLSQK
jgi:DNA-binding ferritin-like protein